MEITKLPTDNLYKFMALSGLLVCILSVLVPFTLVDDAVTKQIGVYSNQEIDFMKLDDIDREIREVVKSNDGKLTEAQRNELLDKLNAVKIEGQKTGAELLQFGYLRKKALMVRNWAIFFFFIGLVTCMSGFWLWYVRVQKYQDMILKRDAEGAL